MISQYYINPISYGMFECSAHEDAYLHYLQVGEGTWRTNSCGSMYVCSLRLFRHAF